jgi:hypothetical protein
MSTLLYGGHVEHAPVDEQLARATTEPVDIDAPPAVEKDTPEFNEVERDHQPHAGIVTSNLASHYVPSRQYVPGWADNAQVTPSFAQVNAQQATSGTAAAREMAGQQGHGTMAYAIGIEPVIRDGGAMGNDYFAAERPGVQPTAGAVMEMSPGYDRDISAGLSAYAMTSSHEAAQSGYETAWAGAMMPGVRHG